MTVNGYVQQNLTDYFLGVGMTTPPTPDIYYVENQVSVSNSTTPAETSATFVSRR